MFAPFEFSHFDENVHKYAVMSELTCKFCNRVCKNIGGLKNHLRKHAEPVSATTNGGGTDVVGAGGTGDGAGAGGGTSVDSAPSKMVLRSAYKKTWEYSAEKDGSKSSVSAKITEKDEVRMLLKRDGLEVSAYSCALFDGKPRRSKVAESEIEILFKRNKLVCESHDKRISGSQSKYRPDFVFGSRGVHKVIVEVDERAHGGNDVAREVARMREINDSFGVPIYWIRYNPHADRCKKREISSLSIAEREHKLVSAIMLAQQTTTMGPWPVEYLFYDEIETAVTPPLWVAEREKTLAASAAALKAAEAEAAKVRDMENELAARKEAFDMEKIKLDSALGEIEALRQQHGRDLDEAIAKATKMASVSGAEQGGGTNLETGTKTVDSDTGSLAIALIEQKYRDQLIAAEARYSELKDKQQKDEKNNIKQLQDQLEAARSVKIPTEVVVVGAGGAPAVGAREKVAPPVVAAWTVPDRGLYYGKTLEYLCVHEPAALKHFLIMYAGTQPAVSAFLDRLITLGATDILRGELKNVTEDDADKDEDDNIGDD